MNILTGEYIVKHGIVSGFPDVEAAIQPNGVDVSVESIEVFNSPAGRLMKDDKYLPPKSDMGLEDSSFPLHLPKGPYLVRLTEELRIPKNYMAYLLPRSTLLRSGVTIHTAVWDAGYEGRGQVLLNVVSPWGFEIGQGARIGQLVFHAIGVDTGGYQGSYQGEGLPERHVDRMPEVSAKEREQWIKKHYAQLPMKQMARDTTPEDPPDRYYPLG